MPISAYKCDVNGQPVHFKDCIGCAAKGQAKTLGCNHSPDILSGIHKNIRQAMPALSVTELMECPRALWFKKKVDYVVQPSRLYWSFRGQMVHSVLEDSQEPGDITEQRMFVKVGEFELSGQPDRIRGTTIFDWKTTNKIPSEPNEHHITQLSCYRWIAVQQDPPIPIHNGKIVYLDMKHHVMMDAKLWSLEQTEKWIKEKLSMLSQVLASDTPPSFEANFSPKNWKCGSSEQYSYCEVRSHCTNGQTIPEAEPSKRKVKSSKG